MSKKVTLKLDFPELEVWRKKLDAVDGNYTKRAINNALIESQTIVADKCEAAMIPHNRNVSHVGQVKTSDTIIRDRDVRWHGSEVEIDVGFRISLKNGGSPVSIFLMRGTEVLGQPHVEPDKKLYDAVYGRAVKREARQAQMEAFEDVIREAMR